MLIIPIVVRYNYTATNASNIIFKIRYAQYLLHWALLIAGHIFFVYVMTKGLYPKNEKAVNESNLDVLHEYAE